MIDGADFFRVLLALAQGDDGGDLDGLEDSVIEIAFNAREGADHAGVPEAEADAPSGHVVTFRERENLDGDIFRAFHLKNAGRSVAVEAEVGVSEIVNHHGAVMAREADDLLEEIEVDALRGGIVREGDENHPRRLRGTPIKVFKGAKEGRGVGHREHAGVAFGHDDAVLMNGIAGVR